MDFVFYLLIPVLIIALGIYYLLYKSKQRQAPQKNYKPIDDNNFQQQEASGYEIPVPPSSTNQRKRGSAITASGCLGAFVFIIAAAVLMIWIIPGIRGGYKKAKEKRDVRSNAAQYTESEYKELCQSVAYEEIARDGNARSGEYFTFSGEVLQEIQDGIYRLSVNDDADYIIFSFESNGKRILEGDTVTIWGESAGFIEGETVLGTNAKAPKIEAVYVTIENVDSQKES